MERERWGLLKESPGPLRTFPELSGCPESALLHGSGLFLSFYHGGYRVAGVPLRCRRGRALCGGVPAWSLAYPAFHLLSCPPPPHPPTHPGPGGAQRFFGRGVGPPPDPLPLRGRGCPKVYFAGGFAPGTPALNRLRHLQILPYRCLAGSWLFCGTGFRRPGKAPRLGFQRAMPVPRPFSPRGCKGRSL